MTSKCFKKMKKLVFTTHSEIKNRTVTRLSIHTHTEKNYVFLPEEWTPPHLRLYVWIHNFT